MIGTFDGETPLQVMARAGDVPRTQMSALERFPYYPNGPEPLWEIPELDEYDDPTWSDYLRANWVVRCPWQELAENGPDFVHLRTVHGAADVPELESLTYDGIRSHLRSRVNFATPRGAQPGRIDTDSWGPGYGVARVSGIIDALFVAGTTPIDYEQTLSIKAYKVKIS